VASSPKGNDRRRPYQKDKSPSESRRFPRPPESGGAEWLWGRHAVDAAVANPHREGLKRLLAVSGKASHLEEGLGARGLRIEIAEANEIARLLPTGAVHQGLALLAEPATEMTLEELADPAEGVLILLDQVGDPQNVGALFRSAAAFGVRGIIMQDRRAPPLSGALAKAAAGAVDKVPCARVVNLSRALETLSDLGWRAIGLAGEAETTLDQAFDGRPVVLVLGSEGEGLRRLVSEHCDLLAAIPMPGGFESLNVATAAAIALYEATRPRRAPV
jgi:23S rRNA (guanosine2251-2'-O)-methyltransferase